MAWERREPEKLERRIRIERDGTVTALSGKIDFGQGIRTAFAQLVADELDVPIERVNVVLGDTAQVPDDVPLMPNARRHYSGKPMPRLEARDIVTGRATYVADVRLPGMLRGAIVRPPQRGAKVRSLDDSRVRDMPGVKVVRSGDVVGVVAEREEHARAAAGSVLVEWDAVPVEGPSTDVVMRDDTGVEAKLRQAAKTVDRTYVLPAIASAPIGPSAAVADVRADGATVY